MNINVLSKLESAWVKYDWKEVVGKITLSNDDIDTLISKIDNFKKNRKAKELVLCKYKNLSAYVTISKNEYADFLDWLYKISIKRELYEYCKQIIELKTKL